EERPFGLPRRDQAAGLRQSLQRKQQSGAQDMSSSHRQPFTQRTCLSVCTTSTRSDWFAITSSMFLYAPGISSITPLSLRQITPAVCASRSFVENAFCAALRLIFRPAPCAQEWKLSAEPLPRTM